MVRFRSILPLILVLVTTLLVSCGGPSAKTPPPTYTAEKIEQLQTFLAPIEEARERISTLANYIQRKDWGETKSLIHGPLGSLRHDMSYMSRNLLPSDQKKAQELSKDFFFHIEKIDAAASGDNYAQASQQYQEALDDFDAFLNLIPKPSENV